MLYDIGIFLEVIASLEGKFSLMHSLIQKRFFKYQTNQSNSYNKDQFITCNQLPNIWPSHSVSNSLKMSQSVKTSLFSASRNF